ncbi:MAG: DUF4307 domain-containing protein [Nocardioidaceae bacterium]
MSAPAPDLARRYGGPSGRPGLLLVAAVVVVATAALGWLAWVALSHGRPAVSSQLIGFEVQGEHAVTASYTVVRRDPAAAASCLLRALAADHSVVGEVTVSVPGGPTVTPVESRLRTERRATSVDLVGCTAGDQTRRR